MRRILASLNRTRATSTAPAQAGTRSRRSGGQVIVIFAASMFLFVGLSAVVVDVAWFWANSLKVQRAADAAALAGAVLLPGRVNTGTDNAYLRATNEASKNGYATGSGVTVVPTQASQAFAGGNPRELDVTISAPVPTFFMRLVGINSLTATRTAKAEYVLPVPMGSPQNYYGVGLFIASQTTTGLRSGLPLSGTWTNPSRADGSSNNSVATSGTTNAAAETWNTFGLLTPPNAFPATAPLDGIEVVLTGNYTGSSSTSCQLQVQLSWNNGVSWAPTTPTADTTITLAATKGSFTLGDAASTDDWAGHTWTQADLADDRLAVRLTFKKGTSCGTGRSASVDTLQVRITGQAGPRSIYSPTGTLLTPQNFWAGMQSQGSPNIQGDAFMTKYSSRNPIASNGVNGDQDPDAVWDPDAYYNYAVEVPPNATNGQIWIFDPGFCEVATSQGTGEYWTVGGDYGNSSAQPASAFYDVYNTRATPYDPTDDTLVATSGTTFKDLSLDDEDLGGSHGSSSCTSLSWHNNWWQLASGLTGGPTGTTYRVHTHTDDTDQDNVTALNSFAIWSTASGGTPRVYGIGAMEAYVRLPGGQASQFYLAQISAVHAGKTMQIDLWDPGDTGNLSASLQILQPTSTGFTPVSFNWVSSSGTTDDNGSTCPASGSGTSITTNTGGSSLFNGCWLRVTIILPDTYTAPTPTGETEGGWWKIKYTMGGATTSYSTDLTTWKVQILGNPVHLIP